MDKHIYGKDQIRPKIEEEDIKEMQDIVDSVVDEWIKNNPDIDNFR